MKNVHNRLLSGLLAVLLTAVPTISSLAEIGGMGSGTPIPMYSGGGASGFVATQGVTRGWGLRITFTTSESMLESGVTILPSSPTDSDLSMQFNEARDVATKRYIEPGMYGLTYYTGQMPMYGVVSSTAPSVRVLDRNFKQDLAGTALNPQDVKSNVLAWQTYQSDPTNTTRPGVKEWVSNPAIYEYKENVRELVYGDVAVTEVSSNGAGVWLDKVKGAFYDAMGIPRNSPYSRDMIKSLMAPNGQIVNDNFMVFTWSSNAEISNMGDPTQKVMWSKLGYVTALMQICWAAQEIGDFDTYNDMASKLGAWASTDYTDASLMPIVMIESTSCASFDGSPDSGKWIEMTLPFVMQLGYGNAIAQQLYSAWPDDCIGSTDNALLTLTNGLAVDTPRQSQIIQGINYYPLNGAKIGPSAAATYKNRNYLRTTNPVAGNANVFGYIHMWTYFSDTPIGGGNPPTGEKADGSFTWKLNPNGVHDVTPDTEVNASSTLYDINMSQSNYNKNNFAKWQAMVNGDSSNENQVRINIYRISQKVPKGDTAGEFTRGQVLKSGTSVLNVVDRVVRGDGEMSFTEYYSLLARSCKCS